MQTGQEMKKISLTVVVALLCGCASYTKQTEQFKAQWIAGNTEVAAQIATDEAESRADSRDAIVWRLEQGAALRADGKPMESNVAFDEAEPKIKYYREDAARVRASKEVVSAVTNLAAVPYEGYGYDRVMLHTYKALNYLQLGEKDAARVEFKRAENAQKNELERNAKRLEAARETKQDSSKYYQNSGAKIQDELTALEPRIDEDYGDFGNPFYDFMHTLSLWTQDNSENALVSLRRINSTVGGLQFLEDEIKLVNDVLDGKSSPRLTYVVYESGLAPLREEKTIGPFPIPAGTDEDGNPIVITFYAALPKLSFRGEPSSMTVRVGESSFSSTRLCNMDAVVAREFKSEQPGVIARTIVSSALKALASYEAQKRAGDIGMIAGLLYQAASTQADLRTWTSLPKEFHVCRVTTPTDRAIGISTSRGGSANVTIIDGLINIVYIKDFGPNTLLKVDQFKLK